MRALKRHLYPFIITLCIALLLGTSAIVFSDTLNPFTPDRFILYGPLEIEREIGTPEKEEYIIPSLQQLYAPYKLVIENGNGKRRNSVSSAKVVFNEEVIFVNRDFKKKDKYIEEIIDVKASNKLEVTLFGAPGASMKIYITGSLQPGQTTTPMPTIFPTPTPHTQLPVDGIIGEWLFSGNADDTSTYNNDGIVHGAALTSDRFGNPNSAYIFDGVNDYINLGDIPITYSEFSISLWFKTFAWIQDGINSGALITNDYNYWQNPPKGWALWVHLDRFWFSVGRDYTAIAAEFPGYKDEWVHLVYTKSTTGQSRMYINGSEVTSYYNYTGWSTPSFPLGQNVDVGRRADEGWYFKGKIDDIRIYNTEIW